MTEFRWLRCVGCFNDFEHPLPGLCPNCSGGRVDREVRAARADRINRLEEELRACRELRDGLVRLTTDKFGDYPDEPEIQEWKDACAREELEEALKEAMR